MELIIITGTFLSISLSISLVTNFFLYHKTKALKQVLPTLTQDAQKLLAEFASGRAILKIDVIDPGDILIRSPRS